MSVKETPDAPLPIEDRFTVPKNRTRCRSGDIRVSTAEYRRLRYLEKKDYLFSVETTDIDGKKVTIARARVGAKAVLASRIVEIPLAQAEERYKARIEEIARPIADAIINYFRDYFEDFKNLDVLDIILFAEEHIDIGDIKIPRIGLPENDTLKDIEDKENMRENFPRELKETIEDTVNRYLQDNVHLEFSEKSIWDTFRCSVLALNANDEVYDVRSVFVKFVIK